MGKHTNSHAVNRAGLLRRYARLRGVSVQSAEKLTRTWSRTELREVVEQGENESTAAGVYVGQRQAWLAGQTTTVHGLTR